MRKDDMHTLKGLAIIWGWIVVGYLLKTVQMILQGMGYG
jgi:hypothetical protein